jgi:CheY-like chemotaxis protein
MGLDLAREHQPDLIVVDVHLPDIPGDQVTSSLRNGPATGRTPMIVTSADSTPKQRKRLIAAGATEYLSKPLNVKRFLAAVDDALGTPARRFGRTCQNEPGFRRRPGSLGTAADRRGAA